MLITFTACSKALLALDGERQNDHAFSSVGIRIYAATGILFSYFVGWCSLNSWSKVAHKDILKQGRSACPRPQDDAKLKQTRYRWERPASRPPPAMTLTSSVITWHDTASRFIFRQDQFSQTWAGTRPQKTNVICDLHQTASSRVHGSTEFNQSIMGS